MSPEEVRRYSFIGQLLDAAKNYVEACNDRRFNKDEEDVPKSVLKRIKKRVEGTKRDLFKAAERYTRWKDEELKRTAPIVLPALQRYGEGFEHKLSETQLAALGFVARTVEERAKYRVFFYQATFEVLLRRGYTKSTPEWVLTDAGLDFYKRMLVQCDAAFHARCRKKEG